MVRDKNVKLLMRKLLYAFHFANQRLSRIGMAFETRFEQAELLAIGIAVRKDVNAEAVKFINHYMIKER
jgi:hypothetical protein